VILRILRVSSLLVVVAAGLFAQRFEITPTFGYKFGGTVPVFRDRPESPGPKVTEIKFKSSAAYGVNVAYNFTEHFALEFMWNRQPTRAEAKAGGGGLVGSADADIDQYFGSVVYNFGDIDSRMRPFLLFGGGATRAAAGDGSQTKGSFHLGGGLKMFLSENMGVRLQMRWTPTYLYSTPGGVWCDWWGFCWGITNDHFMNQGEASVGWIFRF